MPDRIVHKIFTWFRNVVGMGEELLTRTLYKSYVESRNVRGRLYFRRLDVVKILCIAGSFELRDA